MDAGITAYEELGLDTLEDLAARAKAAADREKEKLKREEEEYAKGTLSEIGSLIIRDVKRFKGEIIVCLMYALIAANLLFVCASGVIGFFAGETTLRFWNQPLLAAIESVFPLIVWAISTKFDAFNYHRIKFFTFNYCLFNWIIVTMGVFRVAIMRMFRILFFSIPTSGSLKPIIIVAGYYTVTGGIIIFATLALCWRVLRSTKERIMYRKIIRFRLARVIPEMPWNRRFSYDMCIVRHLDTGKMHRILEEDRRLHSKGVGSTGGGKTATIGTVVIESDLRRKVKNMDYQKKIIEKLIRENKITMTRDFDDVDFNIDYFVPKNGLTEKEKSKITEIMKKLKFVSKSAGMTVMCPNKAFTDELYAMIKAKGLRVNRVDPFAHLSDVDLEDIIGFSPIYVPLIEGEKEDDYFFRVFTAAMLYADVNQAIFELSGKGDPYFTGLNKNLSVTAAVAVIIAYPLLHPGEYATILQVQEVINDFNQIKPYRNALVQKYGKKNESGIVITTPGSVNVGPNLQFIVDRIDRDFLGSNALKINEQATGLRNIIDESLTNPYIKKLLCAKKTLNLDRALEMGEITLVNFEISLGSNSTGFGMFFMLSFIQAVLRRPGTLKTRLPHFFTIDEAPMLFHPRLELCTTLFRQYNVAMLLFMQSLSQYEKNDTTRYLKTVLTGNCAHQIIFGRASAEDMKFYQELSGLKLTVEESESMRETSLSDENTSQAYTHSSVVEEGERITTDDVRYREFLECTVFSAQHSTPIDPFLGKTHFLPKGYDAHMRRRRINWHQFFDYSMLPVMQDEKDIVGYSKDGAVTNVAGYMNIGEETIEAFEPLLAAGPPKEEKEDDKEPDTRDFFRATEEPEEEEWPMQEFDDNDEGATFFDD